MLFRRLPMNAFGAMVILSISITLSSFAYFITRQLVKRISTNRFRLPAALRHNENGGIPRLCFLTRVHGPQIGYLPVLVLSLYHAGLENDRIFVINTDNRTDIQLLKETINFINDFVSRTDYVTLLEFPVHSLDGNFGYAMTDHALSHFYSDSALSSSSCQYITFTNGDNFYSRSFGSKVIPHMRGGTNIIAWGFVSHHYWSEFQEMTVTPRLVIPQIYDDGSNKCINVSFQISRADLGTATYRLAFLKRHKLYFRHSDGSYSHQSDGMFIRRAATLTNSSVLLRQTLFVHQ